MNTTGWWPNTTTPTRNKTCTATTDHGACGVSSVFGAAMHDTSFRNSHAAALALTATATAAFQPKCVSMKAMSHCHTPATISTGGAAKGVSVPPMDTLTNSTPSVP